MGKNLFEEDAPADDAEEITVNEEFARRFEHNNRRADLHRLKELVKDGLVHDSDTEESESEVESSGNDEDFFDNLNKVKNRDPSIYHNKDASLLDSDSHSEDDDKKKEKKKASLNKVKNRDPSIYHNKDASLLDSDSHSEDDDKKKEKKKASLNKVKNRDPSIYHNKVKDASLLDSDSHSEDDDKKKEKKKASLNKVKNRDPSIYHNKDASLLDSDSHSEDDDKKKEKKKASPAYLKDLQFQQLMKHGPEGGEDDEEDDDDDDHDHGHAGKDRKTYLKEQEELMKALRGVEGESGLEGDLLKEVDGGGKGRDSGEDYNGELEKKVGEYFGEEAELDEKARFLRDYFLKKMWDDKDKDQGVDMEEVKAVIEDEDELERLDQFEEAICYRHEENAGDRVMGHSRIVEGSVRKKGSSRKDSRLRREERMKNAENEKKEELKRLKNLKKQEIQERMRKIMDAAGIKGQDSPLDLDLEKDDEFDPLEHDKIMSKAFDDKYYEAEDPEFGSDMEKPNFDEEDKLLGLPEDEDVPGSDEWFSAASDRALKTNAEKDAEKAKEEMLDEYYKLDCEGFIGDLKTRFKYRKVQPNRYGMKPEDILLLDEKELNQYISMKKLAVYRENEWKLPNSKRHQLKMRAREVLRGVEETDQKMGDNKKRKRKVSSKDSKDKSAEAAPSKQDERAKSGVPNPDEGSQSSQAKRRRRRRQEELKMAPSRRVAYTQAQPKPKS